jgi:hypothetical protein
LICLGNKRWSSLFDLGDDDAGVPIEQEIAVTRTRLAEVMEHLLSQCCAMVGEAIQGARINAKDLDRILLVGGPTQSSLVQTRLQSEFGVPVDFSVDPMTVVGRGAAIYAATLEKTNQAPILGLPEAVVLKLAFEPVSADLQPAVAGMVTPPDKAVHIKIDADSGHWTSGWLATSGGFFETAVQLSPADITTFWTYVRDSRGRLLDTQPSEFRIRHGLVPTASPLPHTLSFVLLGLDGKPQLDPVFLKGSPLLQRRSGRTQQALPGVFIDQVQHPHRPPIMRLRTHHVVAPDMVGMLRTESHARPIVRLQPASWLLFLWNLQPLTTPDPLHPVLAALPACSLEQCRNPAIGFSCFRRLDYSACITLRILADYCR